MYRTYLTKVGSKIVIKRKKVKKKNPVNKNQGWELIHQKYKTKENTCRHNPKEIQKQTINQNQVKKK
jgi:hypothetical protein